MDARTGKLLGCADNLVGTNVPVAIARAPGAHAAGTLSAGAVERAALASREGEAPRT
jgi:hypothetical protein